LDLKNYSRSDLLLFVSRNSNHGSDSQINITSSREIWLADVVGSQEISAILFGKGRSEVAG